MLPKSRKNEPRYHLRHRHRPRRSHRHHPRVGSRRHRHHRPPLHACLGQAPGRTGRLHPDLRPNPLARERSGGRSAGQPLPRAPFVHGRGLGGDFLPRLGLHPPAGDATARRPGVPRRRTGRIHPARLPQRQDGPEPGRSRGRPHRLDLGRHPPHGHEPDARRLQPRAGPATRPAPASHLAHGAGAGLQRPRRPGVCRPLGARSHRRPCGAGHCPPGRHVQRGQRPEERRPRGHRGRDERGQVHPAQCPGGRRTCHCERHPRHHARRHRGHPEPGRHHLPFHRHGRHPPDHRHHREPGHRAELPEAGTGGHRPVGHRRHLRPRAVPAAACRHPAPMRGQTPRAGAQQGRPPALGRRPRASVRRPARRHPRHAPLRQAEGRACRPPEASGGLRLLARPVADGRGGEQRAPLRSADPRPDGHPPRTGRAGFGPLGRLREPGPARMPPPPGRDCGRHHRDGRGAGKHLQALLHRQIANLLIIKYLK